MSKFLRSPSSTKLNRVDCFLKDGVKIEGEKLPVSCSGSNTIIFLLLVEAKVSLSVANVHL